MDIEKENFYGCVCLACNHWPWCQAQIIDDCIRLQEKLTQIMKVYEHRRSVIENKTQV